MELYRDAADTIERLETENATPRGLIDGKDKEFHETVNAQIMELDRRQIAIDQWQKRCDEQGKEIERLSIYGVGHIKWGDLKKLEADLARVTAERDAAIKRTKRLCYLEYHGWCDIDNEPCDGCAGNWRGPQKEGSGNDG